MNNYWLRSGFLTLLEKGSGLVFALGAAMLLLRGLSKADFAAWGIFLVAAYFLEMGRAGLIQNGLVRFLAIYKDDEANYARISSAALALNIVFSLVSNAALYFATDWLCRMYDSPQLASLLPVYYATNIAMAFFYQFNFVQQANFEFRGIFWSTFFFRGSLFAWAAYCFMAGKTLELQHLAFAMLAGGLLGAAASWYYARPFLRMTPYIDFSWLKQLAAYGKYVLGTNLSTMFYKNIDKLALGSLLGPGAFAVYDAAGKVTQMVEAPSFSIAAVVFPQSAQRMETEGAAGVKWLYERSVAATLAIILPFVVFSLVFAAPIIRVFAGAAYMDSANVLRLTAFFGLFMPFAVQFGAILDSTGRPAVNFIYTLFTALLNLVLSYVFVRQFGLLGAAYATLAGYSISFVLMQRLLRRDYGIRWQNAFLYLPEMYGAGAKLIAGKWRGRTRANA